MTQSQYENRRKLLIEYLLDKVAVNDWHGTADAAMDLRELDAYWRGLNDNINTN